MARRNRSEQTQRTQRALTRNLAPLLQNSVARPHAGWLHATREALGMSRSQLAARMGVTTRRISQLEQAEKLSAIKLDTLRRAADALNCDLVYAFVPRGSYEAVIEEQAHSKSSPLLAQVTQTMLLENQKPNDQASRRLRRRYVDELAESGQLWDL